MKFFKQVVLPIAILVGLIGLVTYLHHFRNAAPRQSRSTLPAGSATTHDE